MLDEQSNPKSKFKFLWTTAPPPDNSPPTESELLHLSHAEAALSYLSTHSIHFPYLSKQPPAKPLISTWAVAHTIRLPLLYVTPTRSNLIIDGLPSSQKSKARSKHIDQALKTYAIMSGMYGGLHLAGWKYGFRSAAEMWLWRTSGLVMVGLPAAGVVLLWLSDIETKLSVDTVSTLTCLVLCICLMGYPVARIYVLVESFASLRASDPDVYKTVEWTNFWPHAG
ncbi:hypothetical protein CC80DRAFT_465267 [Byssothecium circinans]|uniref:Uncharacterized protein n=1 Tax=Byssothecium circinans TaxID=147558 RepID=A0A6A5UAB7_9PLEO|nr:hypothetical protein CC80DRAFT_465267 [Byssothecium circinans]